MPKYLSLYMLMIGYVLFVYDIRLNTTQFSSIISLLWGIGIVELIFWNNGHGELINSLKKVIQ